MPNQTDPQKQWAKIVAKAWADDGYKARLIAAPKSVLAEEGVELDEEVQYRVVEAAENQVVLVLPPKLGAGAPAQQGEARRSAWLFK